MSKDTTFDLGDGRKLAKCRPLTIDNPYLDKDGHAISDDVWQALRLCPRYVTVGDDELRDLRVFTRWGGLPDRMFSTEVTVKSRTGRIKRYHDFTTNTIDDAQVAHDAFFKAVCQHLIDGSSIWETALSQINCTSEGGALPPEPTNQQPPLERE